MRNTCILLVVISFLVSAGAYATQYSPIPIGVDFQYGYAFRGLNASGQALFTASDGALLWSRETGAQPIVGAFWGLCLGNNGNIVGCRWVSEDGSDYSACAFIRNASTGELHDLSLPAGTLNSWAWSINDAGQIAGIVELPDGSHPAFWNTDGSVRILDDRSGLGISAPQTNAQGQVVWDASRSEEGYVPYEYHAYTWSETDGLNILPFLTGTESAEAVAINDLGQILGYSGSHAVVWNRDGSITDLGLMTPENFMYMYDINNKGQIVGYKDLTATIWDLSGNATYVDARGSLAYAINDCGEIIGVKNGQAVLWTPVPEPPSILALLAGLGGVGGMALRRRKA